MNNSSSSNKLKKPSEDPIQDILDAVQLISAWGGENTTGDLTELVSAGSSLGNELKDIVNFIVYFFENSDIQELHAKAKKNQRKYQDMLDDLRRVINATENLVPDWPVPYIPELPDIFDRLPSLWQIFSPITDAATPVSLRELADSIEDVNRDPYGLEQAMLNCKLVIAGAEAFSSLLPDDITTTVVGGLGGGTELIPNPSQVVVTVGIQVLNAILAGLEFYSATSLKHNSLTNKAGYDTAVFDLNDQGREAAEEWLGDIGPSGCERIQAGINIEENTFRLFARHDANRVSYSIECDDYDADKQHSLVRQLPDAAIIGWTQIPPGTPKNDTPTHKVWFIEEKSNN